MNIKSLLLGSAVAAVAVTGARAADAIIIAEPEPLEYVRICDTYGVGYFYIPGTETCLKIGGWVRYEIGAASNTDGWSKRARARVELQAKNESDLGTVASYVRFDSRLDNGLGRSGTRDNRLDFQYSLAVGGLEMGFRDSTYTRWFGYGGFTDDGNVYGFNENHYISYTFAGDGFTGFVSADHDNSLNYMPDLAAGVGGKFGNMEALATIGYDESYESVALRGKLTADFGGVQARLAGFYVSNTGAFSAASGNRYWSYRTSDLTWAEWSVMVGLQAPVAERTTVAVDAQYFDGGDWRFVGNVNHQITTGLSALLEVGHTLNHAAGVDDTTWGFLRFQRSF